MEQDGFDLKNSNTLTAAEKDLFISRLKKACRAKGMTVAYLQATLGKANAYFRNMGYISPRIAPQVKKIIPDLNIDYVNNGIGEMFVPVKSAQNKGKHSFVPLLPISAHGGTISSFVSNKDEGSFELLAVPVENADIAIRVSNESMSPTFANGCIVVAKKIDENEYIEWGQAFILDTKNGIILRRILPAENNEGNVVCSSFSNTFPDFTVRKSDILGWYKVLLQIREE